jgi:hypothetical protein
MIKVLENATIKTKELSFQLNDDRSSKIFVESLDYTPLVFISKVNDPTNPSINGTTVPYTDIIYIKLHNSKFIPEIELYCEDSKGILFTELYPFDHDTIVSIFIKAQSEMVMPIRMDFRVAEFETVRSDDNGGLKFLIKGLLDVDELHFSNYEVRKGTSYNVIKNLATQIGLGFASNIDNSNDDMKWINPGDTYKEFIKDVTRYSYISDESFVWTFIDFYYNINYVDVQLELNSFIKNETHPVANKQIEKDDKENLSLLYLTSNKAFKGTNQYISKFNIDNQAFKVNLEIFYRMEATWYDKNTNTITKQYIKEFEADQEKLGSPLQGLLDKNSKLYEENVNDEYFIGKVDSVDNVHKNYVLAKVTNKYNLDGLEKMKMIITLDQINFSIKRFQNIRVEIFNVNNFYSSDADKVSELNNVNKKLSGFWFVTGINYLYKRTGGAEQEVTLMRRDLNINYGSNSDEKHDLSATQN